MNLDNLEQSLPSFWYRDDSVFALEQKEIFRKDWFCIGREEALPEPGDHLVIEVQGESVLVVRNQLGQLNAFHNVCRHRGSRLCLESKDVIRHGGVTKQGIVCPYHLWTYDLDGQLMRAPHMQDLDMDGISLYPIALNTWGGFIFLHLEEETTDFDNFISSVRDAYVRYPLAELKTAHYLEYEVEANWKVLCENFNECYHCGPVHPELCQLVPAFKQGGGADLTWEEGIPHREGATTFTASGESNRRSFPELNEAEQTKHKGDLLYPNLFISMSRDYGVMAILKPRSATHTTMCCYFLFEEFEMNKPDFDASDAIEFWDLINKQDYAICESVQAGMSSSVHKQGVFSPMEDWNLDIREYVRSRIGDLVKEQTDVHNKGL